MFENEDLFHKKQDDDMSNQRVKTSEWDELEKNSKNEIKEQNIEKEEVEKTEDNKEDELGSEYLRLDTPKIKSSVSLEDKQEEKIEENIEHNDDMHLEEKQSVNKENKKSSEEDILEKLEAEKEEKDKEEKSVNEEGKGVVEDCEPIKVFESEVKSPLEWLLTGDKFLSPIGNEELGEDYIRLVSYIFSTFAGSGLGLFLMSTGVFSGLGMAILIYSNIPTFFIKDVFEKIDKATDGLIPLKKYKSITDYVIKYIENSPKRISNKVENKEFKLKIKRELEQKKKAAPHTIITNSLEKPKDTQTKQEDKKQPILKEKDRKVDKNIINRKNDNKVNTPKSMTI